MANLRRECPKIKRLAFEQGLAIPKSYNSSVWRFGRVLISVFLLTLISASIYSNPLVNLTKIEQIESGRQPRAFNKKSGARGLFQITPICLKEWNNFHTTKHTTQDLFNPEINRKIAKWYLEKRIPQMLRYYNEPVTIKNILICYNAGISYVVSGGRLPTETKNYLVKYKEAE